MTDVLIKRGSLSTETHTGTPCEDWDRVAQAREPPEARRGPRADPSLAPAEGVQPSRHLDLEPPASRTETIDFCCFKPPPLASWWYFLLTALAN